MNEDPEAKGDPHDALAVALSQQVDEAMTNRGLSQRRLARAADVAEKTVLDVLKARRSVTLRKLLSIASALDCDLRVDLVPRAPH